jgi:hypothetical protein
MTAQDIRGIAADCERFRLKYCASQLRELADQMERQSARLACLTEALRRNREGYVNILEFRKLAGEQWGQRNGFGGRYGALTREEIETEIAEIDKVLEASAAA